MFLSYNKQAAEKLVRAKAKMLSETLKYLPNEKIEPFFKYVRGSEETFPSDSKLSRLMDGWLTANTIQLPKPDSFESEDYPTPEDMT